jgi:major coat protein
MKLTNMKQEVEKPQSSECCAMKPDSPKYPYGLKLYLDNESLKKLGIETLPEVGSVVQITATAEVCETASNESQLYGDNKNMGLQITDMALSGLKTEKEEKV